MTNSVSSIFVNHPEYYCIAIRMSFKLIMPYTSSVKSHPVLIIDNNLNARVMFSNEIEATVGFQDIAVILRVLDKLGIRADTRIICCSTHAIN